MLIIAGRLLRPPELVDEINLSRPGRHLLLTFDDGGKSALRVSAELNRRVVFVVETPRVLGVAVGSPAS